MSVSVILLLSSATMAQQPLSATNGVDSDKKAETIVRQAIDYWRGGDSVSTARMVVKRAAYRRELELKAWTKGNDKTLVRFLFPPKDAGNASLTLGDNVWSYSPKTNRIVKIPGSMMHQSWMGSDFSYNDLAKSDDVVKQYAHKLLRIDQDDQLKIFVIEAIPREHAPVVWGKEVLFIREDNLILRHEFYDQDGGLVKHMEEMEIGELGGRTIVIRARMMKDEADEWTEIIYKEAEFDANVKDSIFTQASLRKGKL